MKFSSVTLPSMAYLATALAQVSDPFFLTINSTDGTYHDNVLAACHQGAALESLCVGDPFTGNTSAATKFLMNTTDSSASTVSGNTPNGKLIYEFAGTEPQPLQLNVDFGTNVGGLLFNFGETQNLEFPVAFDSNDLMNVVTLYNDASVPPSLKATARYSWYVCDSMYEFAYNTTNLHWVLGGNSHNPSCVEVDVKRTFV